MKKPFLIVQSKYYKEISSMLFEGASSVLSQNGYNYEICNVIGALEIPVAISIALKKNNYSGFVALGCVIRGETYHFEIVARESSRAIMDLAINKSTPIGNGILTVDNEEQALIRADKNKKNFGGHAAKACIQLFKYKN